MGINSLPRIAKNWSSESVIGNMRIQNVMTKKSLKLSAKSFILVILHVNHREEIQITIACSEFVQFLLRVHEKIQPTYEPSKNLSIDEGMIAFKGRLSFRQYTTAKPTKYGIKVWMAADFANGCGKLLCLPWERIKQRSCKWPWHGSSIFSQTQTFILTPFSRALFSWITFWLTTFTHVEQFGSTTMCKK